jgi:hypothetical protein
MCGAKAAKTALFCAKCGTKLETAASAVDSKSTSPTPEPQASEKKYHYGSTGSLFESNTSKTAQPSNDSNEKRKRNLITVAIAVVAVLVFVGIGIANSSGGSTDTSLDDTSLTDETLTDDTTEDIAPVDWAPAGYTQWDDYLAFKWVTDEHTSDCSDCSWWFIEVVSHYGCPGGVYAELNMLDGDSVVDWSNDTVPSLSSSNSAVLEFVHYPYESQLQGQVVDLTCHA